jgi:16S rRNA (cytidine1402-2'-O)-methyltransferase
LKIIPGSIYFILKYYLPHEISPLMNEATLYVIATPIGNLEDMTQRSIRILKEVSAVFCEDTRQSKKLLTHYEVDKPAYSLHSHSAEGAISRALSFLEQGHSIGYLTDCGTPGVSDPGSRLVAAVRKKGFFISPLPGPSALTALASVSGFSGKHIHFAGFLSKKEGRRRTELEFLKTVPGIIIIYESPHRIYKTLAAVGFVFGSTQILIGREMTKMFEEFIPGTADHLTSHPELVKEKGEFAIAIDNGDPSVTTEESDE